MEINRICNRCGEVNVLNSETTKHKDCYTEDGEYIRLTYYDCCRCGERTALQIDTQETLNLFGDYKRVLIDALLKHAKNQTIGKKLIKRKDKLSKQLRNKREALKDVNNGKKLLDENKNIFINALTFQKAGDIINGDM